MEDIEALRLAAHALLKAVVDHPDGDGEASVLEDLRSRGLLGEGVNAEPPIGAFPVMRAAYFLVHVLYAAHSDIAEGYRAGGLAIVLHAQIDKQFLPGGAAPSPN